MRVSTGERSTLSTCPSTVPISITDTLREKALAAIGWARRSRRAMPAWSSGLSRLCNQPIISNPSLVARSVTIGRRVRQERIIGGGHAPSAGTCSRSLAELRLPTGEVLPWHRERGRHGIEDPAFHRRGIAALDDRQPGLFLDFGSAVVDRDDGAATAALKRADATVQPGADIVDVDLG